MWRVRVMKRATSKKRCWSVVFASCSKPSMTPVWSDVYTSPNAIGVGLAPMSSTALT
jgi:hypothetical protein